MSKQTIQVIAYRRETVTSELDKAKPYYLDLEKAPVIRVNFNFEDIKNPEKRKTDFSQKFKLPMTDSNNKFFEHWYNVNISKMVYSQNDEIIANVIVNGNTILTGNLRLIGFYKKAGYYDCVVLGKVSTLFSAIGNSAVRDAFYIEVEDSPGNYTLDPELNHIWTKEKVELSWNGASNSFQNTSGVSLRDSVGGVQRVMYPIQGTLQNRVVWDSADDNNWLNNQADMNDMSGGDRFWLYKLAPAIQLRTVLSNIFRKAGFYWESNFLDSAYFRKIFMTTMDYDDSGLRLPYAVESAVYSGDAWSIAPTPAQAYYAGYITSAWYEWQNWVKIADDGEAYIQAESVTGPAVINGSMVAEPYGGSSDIFEFTPPETANYQLKFQTYFDTTTNAEVEIMLTWFDLDSYYALPYWTTGNLSLNGQTGEYLSLTFEGPLAGGTRYAPLLSLSVLSGASYAQLTFGQTTLLSNGAEWEFTCLPEFIGNQAHNSTINPALGIDPELKQSDFLRDILQRFNLVCVTDTDDPSKVLVEPFKDYIGTGQILQWDNKIDADKEQYLKPTTDLMKAEILFTDKESEDFYNKFVKENMSDSYVYGKYQMINKNPFTSKGVLKNNPVFAPYIVDRPNTAYGSGAYSPEMHNMVVNLGSTFNENGSDIKVKTPHKLFYYNGTPTDLETNYYMCSVELVSATEFNFFKLEYDTYPLCSAYELTANGLPNTNIQNVRCLFWDYNRQGWIQSSSLWNNFIGNIRGTLYREYYTEYFAELYNEESRLMELNIYLTPTDIFNFSWRDTIYLFQAYWRVVKIHNYQAGTESSTKVTLIKVPDLEGMTCISTACDDVEYTIVSSDLFDGNVYNWVDDTEPMGFSQFTSLACCDCVGGEFYMFLNAQTGWCVDPYNEGTTSTVNDDVPGFEMMMAMTPVGGAGEPKRAVVGSGVKGNKMHTVDSSDNQSVKSITKYHPIGKVNAQVRSISINSSGVVTSSNLPTAGDQKYTNVETQTTSYQLGGLGFNGTAYLKIEGRKPIYIQQGTVSDLEIRITATVIDGAIDKGESYCVIVNTGFKLLNGSITQIGHTGGIVGTPIYNTMSTLSIAPTVYYRTVGSGRPQLELKVVCSNGDTYTKLNYTAEIKIKSNNIMNTLGALNSLDAVYQDGDEIAFEDDKLLIFN